MNNIETMRLSRVLKCLCIALLSMCLSYDAFAQYVPTYQVIADSSVTFPTIISFGGSPSAFAKNGTVAKTPLGGTKYDFTYLNSPGFIGMDTVQFNYFVAPGSIVHSVAYVDVVPSIITANSDFATSSVGQAVEVNVLSNDYSSMNVLNLTSIPVVTNGFAFILPDSSIYFQPDPSFMGFGSMNYVVCDSIDNCATGTLTVSVNDGSGPSANDSIYVSTIEETAVSIPLLYEGYEMVTPPINGSATIEPGGVVTYTPNMAFVGADQFLIKIAINGSIIYRDVFIDVLPKANTNTVAFDDYGYTPINIEIDINVTDNDIGNYNIKSFTQPQFGEGVVTKVSGDILKFIPTTDFSGPAEFTYTVKNFSGFSETATVTVVVDDQEPQEDPFELYTNKNTSLVLYYNIPISYTEFDVVNDPNHGSLEYIEGDTTIIIGTQSIDVENLIIYHPDIDYIGDDEFEIDYCVTVNNTCYLTKIIVHVLDEGSELCAAQDCVWPGDSNNDGIANMLDLLQLGRTVGEFGLARTNPTINWYGQFASEWGKSSFGSNLDFKYADTDGNGEVNETDLNSLDSHYDLTHAVHPDINPYEKAYPFVLVPTTSGPYNAGDLVSFDLELGQVGAEAINMYGFTYAFAYNSSFVDPASIVVDFDESSWIYTNNNSPVLTLTKNLELQERVDAGLTRTNGYSVSGRGRVATISFIIDDDLIPDLATRFIPIQIGLENIISQDDNGIYFKLPDFKTEILFDAGGFNDPTSEEDLVVFPNPTDQFLTVHLNGQDLMTEVSIYNIAGVEMFHLDNLQWERAQLSVNDYAEGMYILQAQISDGSVINKKFQVIRK